MFFPTHDLKLLLMSLVFLLDSSAGGAGLKGHHEAGGFSTDSRPGRPTSAFITAFDFLLSL